MPNKDFSEEYNQLNKAQKEAVDAIDGPVMVVAGPGTGKTQILALRIANILTKTDTKADGILCLTFTNAGVKAMRQRLRAYIGAEASKVKVATFHSFGMEMVEKYFAALDLPEAPQLMDEKDSVALCDSILHSRDWAQIRPRSDASRYFRDLKSLISLLKRERLAPEIFAAEVRAEIQSIQEDPENISSRGATKGELKKDALAKMDSLSRTLEAVEFYGLYEEAKKEKNAFDYDDVLEALVKIVELSEESGYFIRENYQYILIDEHQDSSGVQNEFLDKVWGGEEMPNIFVVGDDRQLIYGFGGASLEYFENFKHAFGKAKFITLTENYRSTAPILEAAHSLLQSSITKEKLQSQSKEKHPLRIFECDYPRDEIILAGIEMKERLAKGEDKNEMSILLPKNRQVRSAVAILRDMGLPVSSGESLNFFDSSEARAIIRVLKIIADPHDGAALAESFFDTLSGIAPLDAHKFLRTVKMREFSLANTTEEKSLFGNAIADWLAKLRSWLAVSGTLSAYSLIQHIGTEFLLNTAKNHDELVRRVEVIRTVLHLALAQMEKQPKQKLSDFLAFIDRLESYGEHIPLSVFSADEGIKVLTLHGSKGLEFDYVWIAHMDEKSLAGSANRGFALPARIEEKKEQKDEMVLKRQLYVAITRAKRFCTLSYPVHSYTGGDLELAHIIADLSATADKPEGIFEKKNKDETEGMILKHDPKVYIASKKEEKENTGLAELAKLVAKDYEDRKVSVSLLNNFFECPWKWYFRNLLQLPEPETASLEFGNAVHASIDKILKTPGTPSAKEIENIVTEAVEKSKVSLSQKEVLSLVQYWAKNRLPEISTNRKNEEPVPVSDERFPHLSIYGKIDLIEILDKEAVRVTDFKTGSAKKKSEIEGRVSVDGTRHDSAESDRGRLSNLMRQLAMYSYLLSNNAKWKKDVRESRLEFVESKDANNFYNTVIQPEHISLLVQDIADYDTLLKSGQWLSRPCNFKSYGKADAVCEYCKRGGIYKQ